MKRNLRQCLNRRLLWALAVTAVLLVPLGVLGAPALARSTSASGSQYQYKITICHRTHSATHPWVEIRVSNKAWPAHQRHGDLLVPPATCPPTSTTPPTSPGHKNDNDNDNDDNGNHGNGNNGNGDNGNGNHGNGNNGNGNGNGNNGNGNDHGNGDDHGD